MLLINMKSFFLSANYILCFYENLKIQNKSMFFLNICLKFKFLIDLKIRCFFFINKKSLN